MSKNNKAAIIVGSFIALVVIISGCSNSPGFSNTSLNSENNSIVTTYMPLQEGYSTTYDISHSNGTKETLRFRVGKEVQFNDFNAIEWYTDESDGSRSISYFRITSTALYYYPSQTSQPEKLLETPYVYGHSWDRYTTIQSDYDIIPGDSGDDYKEDNDSDGPNLSFPIAGSMTMTIENFENIQLTSGTYYGNALKIRCDDQSGLSNYYWYVADIGLVKYVLGTDPYSPTIGQTIGELVTYGYN